MLSISSFPFFFCVHSFGTHNYSDFCRFRFDSSCFTFFRLSVCFGSPVRSSNATRFSLLYNASSSTVHTSFIRHKLIKNPFSFFVNSKRKRKVQIGFALKCLSKCALHKVVWRIINDKKREKFMCWCMVHCTTYLIRGNSGRMNHKLSSQNPRNMRQSNKL